MKSLALLALFITLSFCFIPNDESVVNTQQGSVKGRVLEDARLFLSVPFGDTTAGANRFLPPQEPPSRNSVYDATNYGPACPQDCTLPPLTCPTAGSSEDCLHLDIYAPRVDALNGGLVPVMVFFPGGDYKQGGSSTLLYNGDYPANASTTVIVITNYRLGALGFFINDQVDGNLGILDQQQALRWVSQNIKNFGGDPNQVTIFGQSAGGTSVASHMITPGSYPYYQKAIIESSPIQLGLNTRREMADLSKNLAQILNCDYNDIDCFRQASVEDIVMAQNKAVEIFPLHPLKAFMPWQPYNDGVNIQGQPMTNFTTGEYNQVPLMMGNVNDEGWLFIFEAFPNPLTVQQYKEILALVFHLYAEDVYNMYPVPAGETDARPTLSTLGTDYIWACPYRNISRYMSQNNQNLYRYHFDHVFSFNPWGPNYTMCVDKCCHGSELPYIFNSVKLAGYQWNSQEQQLSYELSANWCNFAHSNNSPNAPLTGYTNWPAFTQSNDQDFHYQTPQSSVETGYRKTQCDFFDQIGYYHGQ